MKLDTERRASNNRIVFGDVQNIAMKKDSSNGLKNEMSK